jgi:itaconyl-CoA hydratase
VTIEHRPGRTITEADNVWFTNLTMNPHPLHFDALREPHRVEEAAGELVPDARDRDGHERRRRPAGTRCSNLGWDKVRLPEPVFAGDTIYAEIDGPLEAPLRDASRSRRRHRRDEGRQARRHRLHDVRATFLVYMRDSAPHDSAGY